MKKRILYIGNFLFPEDGAAAKRVLNIGRSLNENLFEVIYCGNNEIGRKEDYIKGNLYKYEDFYYYTKPLYKGIKKRILGYYSFLRIKENIIEIEKEFGEIDIVIGYHMDALGMLSCINYCQSREIKFISDCTEWYDPLQTSGGKYGLNYINSQIRMKIINKKSDGIICISEYLENYYKKFNRVIVIPPLEKISLTPKEINNINYTEKIIKFIYCGSPGKKDDLMTIFKSFSLLKTDKQWVLNIVGITKEDFMENYEYKNSDIPINIHFCGRIPYDKAIEMVKNSTFSLLIRPSDKRYTKAGFPSKVPESMSLATPMICNHSSDLKKYIFNEENGIIVKDSNVSSLLNSINHALNLKQNQIVNLKKQAFITANEHFNYKKYANSLEDFINKVGVIN